MSTLHDPHLSSDRPVSRHPRKGGETAEGLAFVDAVVAVLGGVALITSAFWLPWLVNTDWRGPVITPVIIAASMFLMVPYTWWQIVRISRKFRACVLTVELYPDRMVCKLPKGKMQIPWKKIARIYQKKVDFYINGLYNGLHVFLTVDLDNGRRLKFENDFEEMKEFGENLLDLSLQALVQKTLKRLKNGETVDFGRSIRLNQNEMKVGFERYPLDQLVNYGVQNACLVIDAGKLGSQKIEAEKIGNLHVLLVILENLVGRSAMPETPPATVGTQAGRVESITAEPAWVAPMQAPLAMPPAGPPTTGKHLERWLDEQEPYTVFGVNKGFFLAYQIFGWLLVFIGLVPLIGIHFQVQAQTAPPTAYIFGILFFPLFGVLGIILIFLAFRGLRSRVYCFEKGFVARAAGELKGCRWDEIVAMRKRTTEKKVKTYTEGFQEDIKKVQGKKDFLEISRRDGKTIRLNAYNLSDAFIAEVEKRTLPYLLPHASWALQQGQPLTYEEFTVDRQGVKCLGQGSLPWSNIHRATLANDVVRVVSKDGTKTLSLKYVHYITNTHVLVGLINQQVGKAGTAPVSGPDPWPSMAPDLWITLGLAAFLAVVVTGLFVFLPFLWFLGVIYGGLLVLFALLLIIPIVGENRRVAVEEDEANAEEGPVSQFRGYAQCGLLFLLGLVTVLLSFQLTGSSGDNNLAQGQPPGQNPPVVNPGQPQPKPNPKPQPPAFVKAKTPPPATKFPGLVAYWSLDEGSGDKALDSQNKEEAKLIGAKWVPGIRGHAVEFNGTSDQLDLGTASALNFPDKGPFTLACWIKTSESEGTVLSFRSWPDGLALLAVPLGDKKLRVMVREDQQVHYPNEIVSPKAIVPNEWHHFALTRDADGTIEFFVDGVSVGKRPNMASSGPITSHLRTLGVEPHAQKTNYGSADTRYLQGSVDEFCVFNRLLTPAEITELAGR